jgi:hypothetical protein
LARRYIPFFYLYNNDKNIINAIFIIIAGVFEVDGKLLRAKDGRAVWGSPEQIELEAP